MLSTLITAGIAGLFAGIWYLWRQNQAQRDHDENLQKGSWIGGELEAKKAERDAEKAGDDAKKAVDDGVTDVTDWQ